jgi:hypothetical protein
MDYSLVLDAKPTESMGAPVGFGPARSRVKQEKQ